MSAIRIATTGASPPPRDAATLLLTGRPPRRVIPLADRKATTGFGLPTTRMGIELIVPAGNNPGTLPHVLRVVAAHKLKLLAYCTAFDRDGFTILLVTDTPLAAKTALAKAGFACTAQSVVLVSAEDRAGTTVALFNQLNAARIDIRHAYVASLPRSFLCAVFQTDDDPRALRVLAATNLATPVAR